MKVDCIIGGPLFIKNARDATALQEILIGNKSYLGSECNHPGLEIHLPDKRSPGKHRAIWIHDLQDNEVYFEGGNSVAIGPDVKMKGISKIVFNGTHARVKFDGWATIGSFTANLDAGSQLQIDGNACTEGGTKFEFLGKSGKIHIGDDAKVGLCVQIAQRDLSLCHVGGETNVSYTSIIDSIIRDQTKIKGDSRGGAGYAFIEKCIFIGDNNLNGDISLINARVSDVRLGLSGAEEEYGSFGDRRFLAHTQDQQSLICMHDCNISRSIWTSIYNVGITPLCIAHLKGEFKKSDHPQLFSLAFRNYEELQRYCQERGMQVSNRISPEIAAQFEKIANEAWWQKPGHISGLAKAEALQSPPRLGATAVPQEFNPSSKQITST